MHHLLIVYHSQTGNTERMARAVLGGAQSVDVTGVEVRFLRAGEAGLDDLLWCQAVIFGTPENFGYLSGAMKDFFDRTFYPAQGLVDGLPYGVFISAGNDGTGALRALRRIARGYPLREVQEPIIAPGEVTDAVLERCEELGLGFAAGLELGVF